MHGPVTELVLYREVKYIVSIIYGVSIKRDSTVLMQ